MIIKINSHIYSLLAVRKGSVVSVVVFADFKLTSSRAALI